MRPPGVDGCMSDASRKLAIRGCEGEDGGSTSTDRGVTARRAEGPDGRVVSSKAVGLDGGSKRDWAGGLSSSSMPASLPGGGDGGGEAGEV